MDNLRICPTTAGTLKVARLRRQGTEPVDPWPDTFTSSAKGRGKNGKNKEEGLVKSGAGATISGTESIPSCSCKALPQLPGDPLRTHLCKWSPPPAWESFLDWDALNDLFSEVSAHSLKPNIPTLGAVDVHGLPSDASSTTIIDPFFAHPNTGPCIDPSLTMSLAMSKQMGVSSVGTQQDSGVSQSLVASSILGKRGRFDQVESNGDSDSETTTKARVKQRRETKPSTSQEVDPLATTLQDGEAGLGTMHINDCFWDNEDSIEETEAAIDFFHVGLTKHYGVGSAILKSPHVRR
ncbi:hypothetical protein B0H11DRAFT_2251915 [Mycena galericulata]|nr:hypothetical protein B0H11DRAFT_2251915 [Mycena galericulata]